MHKRNDLFHLYLIEGISTVTPESYLSVNGNSNMTLDYTKQFFMTQSNYMFDERPRSLLHYSCEIQLV